MKIKVPKKEIADYCRRNHIRKLSFFGSVLTDQFQADSDVDILVEFKEGYLPGFLKLTSMERELSKLLGDVKVDIRTPEDLSRYFKEEVLAAAVEEYGEK